MGVVDELVRAHETFERGDWATAYAVWTDVPPTWICSSTQPSPGPRWAFMGRG